MKEMARGLIAVVCVSLLSLSSAAYEVEDGDIHLGVWNVHFEKAKAYAEANRIPLVVVWTASGCGFCNTFKREVCNSAEFKAYQAERKLVMCLAGDSKQPDYNAAHTFCNLGNYPRIAIYWPKDGKPATKKDEDKYKVTFAGRDGEMAIKKESKTESLTSQFIRKIESFIAGYNDYSGGEFVVADTEIQRLEAVAGRETVVEVPLWRANASATAVNVLEASGAATASVTVNWAAGDSEKYPTVTVPATATVGSEVTLTLKDDKGEVWATRRIHVVAEPENSVLNPEWTGCSDFGVWTMDLAAAEAKAKDAGGCTLVYFTGALWCPHCYGLDKGLLDTDDFKAWARDNKITLVAFDNLHRSANEKGTEPYAISTVANGAVPTLLSPAVGTYGSGGMYSASGSAYLSRNGITTAQANAKLQETHDLGYLGGRFCAPSAYRTGYPTLILVKNGEIKGRYVRRENESPKIDDYYYEFPHDENLRRVKEFVKLAETGAEQDKYIGTTTLQYEVAAKSNLTVTVNENVKFYRMNVPAARIDFTAASGKPVSLAVLRKETVDVALCDAAGNVIGTKPMDVGRVLASGTGGVSCTFAEAGEYYLSVTAYADSRAVDYYPTDATDTTLPIELSSTVVLVPQEKKTATVLGAWAADGFGLEVTSGNEYVLEGFTSQSLNENFTKNANDRYEPKAAGTAVVTMKAEGASVTTQLWRPGDVMFEESFSVVNKLIGGSTFHVTRANGSSDSVTVGVRVVVSATDADPVRYRIEPAELSWADGETGTKEFRVNMDQSIPYMPNQTLTLKLEGVGPCADEVWEGPLVLTLSDTDKPVLSKTVLNQMLYTTFAATFEEPQPVYNIQGDIRKVKIKKVAGALPKGVHLKFDADTRSIVLSGKPTKAVADLTSYVFTIQDERGQPGPEIVLNLGVMVPSAVNPYLDRALYATLPLFAEDGVGALVGAVEFTATAKNKVTAKYILEGTLKKVSLSGYWQKMDDGGTARATLANKKGAAIDLVLTADGRLSAVLSEPTLSQRVGSGSYGVLTDFVPYKGQYTVALPMALSGPCYASSGIAIANLDFTKSVGLKKGAVSCSVTYPDGKTGKATAYLTRIDANFAGLTLFCNQSKKNLLSAQLKIRCNAASAPSRRAVLLQEGTRAAWVTAYGVESARQESPEAFGSYYDKDLSLIDCCGENPLHLTFDMGLVLPDGKGAVASVVGSGSVLTVAEHSLTPVAAPKGLKFKFTPKTGIVAGSSKVGFADGKTVTCKFSGVVLPGWYDCGCGDDTDELIPRENKPFVMGTCTFSDKHAGKTVSRGLPMTVEGVPLY